MPDRAALLRYASDFTSVEGWLTAPAADAICDLLHFQTEIGLHGALMEIGVHHGRLLTFLALCSDREPVVGVDVFEDQHLNPGFSGCGSREATERTLATYAPGIAVTLLKAESTTLSAADLPGLFRAVSVDGGHARETVHSDLWLAESVCRDGAIVFLDDFLHPHWLGVTEGYFDYAREGSLVPFCFGDNKLLLAKGAGWVERYREHVLGNRAHFVKQHSAEVGGHPVVEVEGGEPFFARLRG